jgi:hypothetical protein
MHFEHSAEIAAVRLAARWPGLWNVFLPYSGHGAELTHLNYALLSYQPGHMEAAQHRTERPNA